MGQSQGWLIEGGEKPPGREMQKSKSVHRMRHHRRQRRRGKQGEIVECGICGKSFRENRVPHACPGAERPGFEDTGLGANSQT